MTEREELVTLRAEKRQLAKYALELEEEIVRLKGIIAEREHGREHQFQPTQGAFPGGSGQVSTWRL